MKVLVTGGAGFIGSHLVDALLRRGDGVYVIDDLSTGVLANLDDARASGGDLQIVVDRVETAEELDEWIDAADQVYHLAAAVGVRLVVEHPTRMLETNLTATERVLESASRSRTPVFIASTSEVYGKSTKSRFSETDDLLIGPPHVARWGYACSKAYDEFLALAYAGDFQMPVVIGRFFNTVGARQTGQYGMVLPSFAKQAVTGKAITVFGDGTQTRCFCHFSDVIKSMLALMDIEGAAGRVFNIGYDGETSISQLARLVKEISGSESDIVYIPYSEAFSEGFEDIQRRRPDTSRLTELTGIRPETKINELIEEVIADQRARLNA